MMFGPTDRPRPLPNNRNKSQSTFPSTRVRSKLQHQDYCKTKAFIKNVIVQQNFYHIQTTKGSLPLIIKTLNPIIKTPSVLALETVL